MHMHPEGASGKPSNSATWWLLGGSDDADSLRAADISGALNQAMVDLVENRSPSDVGCMRR